MRFLIFYFLIFFSCSYALADEIQIPFSCWPKELKQEFSKNRKKLDLDPNKRTLDSWGYVLNKGDEYSIITYHSATKDDFELIKKITFGIEMRKKPNG